jgi:branched-subunit amino acid transport protein AzlD
VIVIGQDVSQRLPRYRFTSLTPLAPIVIHHAGQPVLSLSVALGTSISTAKP